MTYTVPRSYKNRGKSSKET